MNYCSVGSFHNKTYLFALCSELRHYNFSCDFALDDDIDRAGCPSWYESITENSSDCVILPETYIILVPSIASWISHCDCQGEILGAWASSRKAESSKNTCLKGEIALSLVKYRTINCLNNKSHFFGIISHHDDNNLSLYNALHSNINRATRWSRCECISECSLYHTILLDPQNCSFPSISIRVSHWDCYIECIEI